MAAIPESLLGTVSGSFNRHLTQIREQIRKFQKQGIKVLSPSLSKRSKERAGFVFLDNDRGTPWEIEAKHLDAISRSDFLYVVDPEGYIGSSVAFEMGYALSQQIPIFCLAPPSDPILQKVTLSTRSVSGIREMISTNSTVIVDGETLHSIQKKVARIGFQKEFQRESINDKIVLLTEELGELARAARTMSGLKVSQSLANHKLSEELADCLIYLADIANLGGVDLEAAVSEKLGRNITRKWRVATRSTIKR